MSSGYLVFSAAQSRNVLLKPWGTPSDLNSPRSRISFMNFDIAESDKSLPVTLGKMRGLLAFLSSDLSRAIACLGRGTRCSFFIFVFLAGMVQIPSSILISDQTALRTDPDRTDVMIRNSSAFALILLCLRKAIMKSPT